ncbi:MAG TPA: rhodanese-like domain-containing protein [Flavisolibacter sp.]|jgi:phage shock protein E|nr:rhodanese-like domain-containing protein [Flavisolibacter sp.]
MLNFLKKLFTKDNSAMLQALEKGAVIIDVRNPSEFRQGHIQGSKNIPVNEIRSKVEMIRKWNKPVITVCLSGGRSAAAKSVLASAGIEVYNGGPWYSLRKIIA